MSDEKKPTASPRTRSYRDLLVWQKAIALVKLVYEYTRALPADERFGLTTQMRRAAVSIASNIAEGQARKSTREFVQFISNAEGSAAELDTQFVICVELRHKSNHETEPLFAAVAEVRRMLNGLRLALQKRA
jgi:four helix bundle protein